MRKMVEAHVQEGHSKIGIATHIPAEQPQKDQEA